MPIQLPNLDDVSWKDLNEEARSLIPGWAPSWTNHNASDPGITLVELFAYLTEGFIYRINRVGDENIREFLKLISGSSKEGMELKEAVAEVIQGLRRRRRAVTASDFEALALEANQKLRLPDDELVKRVKCLAEQNLEDESLKAQNWYAPGHVSVVVVSNLDAQPTKELLRRIFHSLEPARLLGTRLHVVGPRYVSLGVRLTLVSKPNTIVEALRERAVKALENFFDPISGGLNYEGWPFGRHVYVSEVYQLLDEIPGVDYVRRSSNPLIDEDFDELVVAPGEGDRLRWNALGELEAMTLQPFELVDAQINPASISVVPT